MRTRDRSGQASLFRYSPLAAALAIALAPASAVALTYTVNDASDAGGTCATTCTLRQAFDTANANCASDPAPVINFALTGTGPFVISPSFALSVGSCGASALSITVDGTTQTGYSPTTNPNGFNDTGIKIVVDATNDFDFSGVFYVNNFPYGNSLTLKGVEVRNFTYGSGSSAIYGNVRLFGSHVHDNEIGVGAYGFDSTNRAVIGGSGSNRNLIRNNRSYGIEVSYGGHVDITNNLIGLDATGAAANPNATGISMNSAQDVNINSNYVAGNTGNGIEVINTGGTPSVSILQNKVGQNTAGGALGNTGTGIYVSSSSNVGILNNVIASNGVDGVGLVDNFGASSGVSISQNSIYGNTRKNINLDFYGGPLPNDTLDVDTGPNARQNNPVISLVTQGSGNTSVSWSLNTEASKAYRLEFFSNASSGTPAGTTFLTTSANQITDGSGNISGVQVISGLFNNISVTATDQALSNTSEFSSAVAVTPTPAVTVSPSSVSFPNTVVGGSSGPTPVTITSTGTAPYVIHQFDSAPTCYGGPICASGGFSCSNTCTTGTPYATNSSCAINVSFTPTVTGPTSTTFYICDNVAGSPRSVTLSGTGVAPPPATISPTSFNFGSAQVGGFSSFQNFTVSNTGPTPMALGTFSTTGQFQAVPGSCGASLAANSSCTVSARYAPTTAGPATGTLSATAGTGTVSASLSGTAPTPPATTISPVSFNFGTYVVGTTSSSGFFTITNPSLVPVNLTAVTATPPFALVSTSCGATLAPNSSCSATANFTPTAVGPATGSLSTTSNGNPVSASLAGTGSPVPPPPTVSITPSSVNYGVVTVGATSTLTFTIFNPASAPATFSSPLSATAPYSVASDTCGTSLPASSSCSANVAFTPTAPGAAAGTFTVPASTGTVSASLTGTGLVALPLSLSPPSLEFGSVLVGQSSATHLFTLLNPNTVTVPLTALVTTGPFSIASTTCASSIAPSATCGAQVKFTPNTNGPLQGTLIADTTGTVSPGSASVQKTTGGFGTSTAVLTGTGLFQSSLTAPDSVDMGSAVLGSAPVLSTVTLGNSGNAALSLDSITIASPFSLTTDCPVNLLPQDTCHVNLTFVPSAIGNFTGSLVVISNSAGGSRSIPVKASVQARPEPVISVSPQSIGYGDRMFGTSSIPQRVTITNSGGGDATGFSVGAGTPHFTVTTTCGKTLAAQSTCYADVVFAPQGFGPRRDYLFVRSNAPNSPSTVNLSGAGCRPVGITSSRGGAGLNCAP